MKKTQTKTSYKRVGKNIYKTGNSYRVRVMGFSKYLKTRKAAYEYRNWVLSDDTNE